LAGAISRGISEDTASLIAGQFNAVRIDVKAQLEAQLAMVDHLFEIAENTRYNKNLEQIRSDISVLKESLTS
jgi:hypothetical protein